jgi:putative ABC transport system ATP-binding protein
VSPAANAIILAEQLTRVYQLDAGEVSGIREVNLAVAEGELVVLKGVSGSGKSTLLGLIAGLDRPTSGRLEVSGHLLHEASQASLTQYRRKVVGMVFQSFNLLPTLTLLENVCLPALLAGESYRETRSRASEIIKWLDLSSRLHHFPAQLSGGEMQRTAIARALINDPPLLLADEPTGNLDSRNGRAVVELLAHLNRSLGRTVIIATHADLADRFASSQILLRDGRIATEP